MTTWIERTLMELARRRASLDPRTGAAMPAGENAPQPTGQVGLPQGPRPPGEFGGAGESGQPSRAALQAQVANVTTAQRRQPLMDAYNAYLKRSGRGVDPLISAKHPARLLTDKNEPGELFTVNRSGNKRSGLTVQRFELADGRRANVYYGPRGRRTVVWLRPTR